ncbi:MAG: putative metal-binding motif-containing protein [Sandaracinus sp.]
MRDLWGWALAGACGLAMAGCPGGQPAATCVSGSTQACVCDDGSTGAQRCGDDGRFGACSCAVRDAGAGDAGATPDGGSDGGLDGGACVMPDVDGDGVRSIACGGDDCDDADPTRAPTLSERCDPEDRDEDCDPSTFGFRDQDSDSYPDQACCNTQGDGTLRCGGDCDDVQPGVHPDAPEVCNGRDDDCDSAIDEGLMVTVCRDCDGDGHGVPLSSTSASCGGAPTMMGCSIPMGYATTCDDCDDGNVDIYGMHPELCDGIDNDCDGTVDDGAVPATWYADCDSDNRPAAGAATQVSCTRPVAPPVCNPPPGACSPQVTAGWTVDPPTGASLDCDDFHQTVYPSAPELCDGLDNDCDGSLDRVMEDVDGDGFAGSACTSCRVDCNDARADTHPSATELPASGRDEDCDGSELCYQDTDHDTYGGPMVPSTILTCTGTGIVARAGDCCDHDSRARPGATMFYSVASDCGGYDFDCDGMETRQYGCDYCDIGAGCTEQAPGPAFLCFPPTTVPPACGQWGQRIDGCYIPMPGFCGGADMTSLAMPCR